MTLQFLEFPFNRGEVDAVRQLAAELGMALLAFRGAVPDPRWPQESVGAPWFLTHTPARCPFLWGQPVLCVDGGLSPCRGAFQGVDDFARLAASPGEEGVKSFREAWNSDRYRAARELFRSRTGGPEVRRLPCYECPTAIFYERWIAHRAAGGTSDSFDPGMERGANGAWNYFWERGQRRAT